jgi:formylglycine-generating enzyme required for sulfatase activity
MRNCSRSRTRGALLGIATLALLTSEAAATSVIWLDVGGPGNAADLNGFGAVTDEFRIGKFEVTNSQYVEFLNAVAGDDTYSLYNSSMAFGTGGISQSGAAGSYSYAAIAGREAHPVNFVSFYDSIRFANWLHNGEPEAPQGPATTEDGAYTITPAGIAANSITRNLGAQVFLPNEDEWYKAGFYDVLGTSYFDYPTSSDAVPTCATPGSGSNLANCGMAVGGPATVGSYSGSPSPVGTYDQAGNLREWNETIRFGPNRGVGGGGFDTVAAATNVMFEFMPDLEAFDQGFRVASLVPEPSTGLLMLAGLLTGIARSRRRERTTRE